MPKINIPIPSKINISIPSKVNISIPPVVKNSNNFSRDISKTNHSEKNEKHKSFENDHSEDFSPKRRKKLNDDNYVSSKYCLFFQFEHFFIYNLF